MEKLTKNRHGQWSLKKEDDEHYNLPRGLRGGFIHDFANQDEYKQHVYNKVNKDMDERSQKLTDPAAMSHIASTPYPNTPIIQAKNLEDKKQTKPAEQDFVELQTAFDIANGYRKYIDKQKGVPEEEFLNLIHQHGFTTDDHDWGPQISNIKPEDIIHHANFTPEDMKRLNYIKNADEEMYSSQFCRDEKTGRVFTHMNLKNIPELSHLHGMFLPTNFHESDPPIWEQIKNPKPSLSGADKMGVLVKKPDKDIN